LKPKRVGLENFLSKINASVRFCKPEVGGSSPSTGTNKNKHLDQQTPNEEHGLENGLEKSGENDGRK
jgi:hypothetical protein